MISRGRGVRDGGVVPGCDLLAATRGSGVQAKVCVMSVKIDLRGWSWGVCRQPSPRRGGKVVELRRGRPKNAVVSDRMPRG